MAQKTFMDFYFSYNPLVRKIIDCSEWLALIAIGIFFNEPQINKSIFIIIMGIILIISGLFMHHLSHKAHRQAHLPKESITSLITTGIYAKIRHPGYLGYFLGYAGIFLVIGSYSMLIPIFLYILSFVHSIYGEEKFLQSKFPVEYQNYIKQTPYRFIPYLF